MRKIVNGILAVALVAVMLIIGGLTLAGNARSLGYALLVTYTQYLEPDSGFFGNVQARIQSVTNAINASLLGKDWFRRANAAFQLALGKEVLSFGGTTMVRLSTGQLYDVQPDYDISSNLDTILRLKDKLDEKGIPMVYAYAHSELYEDGLLPEGVEDYNNKVADDIVSGLRQAGIPTIDSRQVYRDHGLTLDQAVYRTDQHWSILTAFTVFGETLKALNDTGALALDPSLGDLDNYRMEIVPRAHMGDVGARLGEGLVEPDDFQLITPLFPTQITQRISKPTSEGGGFDQRSGSFQEAAMYMDKMEGEGAANRYDTYGLHRELTYFTNEDAPEGRLLILKDSFGTPVSTFYSLAVREVCALDLRKGRITAEEMVEEFQPDAVLVVYCQEMMREKNYVLVD